MVNNKIFRYFFYMVIFVSLLVGLNTSVRRFQFENQTNSVEMALSYNELKKMALFGGLEFEELLTRVKHETAVSVVAIEEETLADFVDSGKITLLKGSEIMNMHRVGHVNRTILNRLYKQLRVKPDYFYLIIDQQRDFERIRDFLYAEFGRDNVNQIKRYNILEVMDTYEDLVSIGLGISPQSIKQITDFGFKPMYRLKNSTRLNPQVIKQKIASFSELTPGSSVFFETDSILGYPSQLPILKDKIEDKQLHIGMVEFYTQNGFSYLAKKLPHSVYRIHSVDIEQLQTMSVDKVVGRYLRAAKERGIDVLFLHPYMMSKTDQSLINFNLSYFNQLSSALISSQFSLYSVAQFPQKVYFSITLFEKLVLSFAVMTTLLLFVSFFSSLTFVRIFMFYFVSMGCIYFGLMSGYSVTILKLMAFLVAVMFPTLAIISQFPQDAVQGAFPVRFLHSLGYLSRLLGVCLIGSILIISFLSDISFLKGIDRFWGVKLSFLFPIFLIGFFFYLRPQRITSTFFVLRRLYYAPVRTAGLLSVFALLIFLLVLVIRSGNLMVLPKLYLESEFRAFLEEIFFVRPRTKEFLVGYPFLIGSFLFVDRYISRLWVWFFNIFGAISLISVVNSFCHIHTPLHISLYRTFLGVFLGVICFFIYWLIGTGIVSLVQRKWVKNVS